MTKCHRLKLVNETVTKCHALKMTVKDGKIEFFDEHEKFFTNENLQKFYNNTILKLENHLVVNL